jgi:hypothetical protein
MSTIGLIFVLLVVYQIKHFVADYPLQSRYMLGKFMPGWEFLSPLLAHVGVHAGFTYLITIIVFGCFKGPWWSSPFLASVPTALAIALFDAVIHFFMDRIKASPRYMGRWKPLTAAEYVAAEKNVKRGFWIYPKDDDDPPTKLRGNRLFWIALGFDQMVHHLTHYGCIYFTLRGLGKI